MQEELFDFLTLSNLFFLPVKLNKQQPLNDKTHRDPEELEEEGSQSENEHSLGPKAAAEAAEAAETTETLTAMTNTKEATWKELRTLRRRSRRLLVKNNCWWNGAVHRVVNLPKFG